MKSLLCAFSAVKIGPGRRNNMRNSLLPLVCLSLCCVATSARAQVSFKEKPNKIEVEIDGRPFTTFHYGPDWPKPFMQRSDLRSSVQSETSDLLACARLRAKCRQSIRRTRFFQ